MEALGAFTGGCRIPSFEHIIFEVTMEIGKQRGGSNNLQVYITSMQIINKYEDDHFVTSSFQDRSPRGRLAPKFIKASVVQVRIIVFVQ